MYSLNFLQLISNWKWISHLRNVGYEINFQRILDWTKAYLHIFAFGSSQTQIYSIFGLQFWNIQSGAKVTVSYRFVVKPCVSSDFCDILYTGVWIFNLIFEFIINHATFFFPSVEIRIQQVFFVFEYHCRLFHILLLSGNISQQLRFIRGLTTVCRRLRNSW